MQCTGGQAKEGLLCLLESKGTRIKAHTKPQNHLRFTAVHLFYPVIKNYTSFRIPLSGEGMQGWLHHIPLYSLTQWLTWINPLHLCLETDLHQGFPGPGWRRTWPWRRHACRWSPLHKAAWTGSPKVKKKRRNLFEMLTLQKIQSQRLSTYKRRLHVLKAAVTGGNADLHRISRTFAEQPHKNCHTCGGDLPVGVPASTV